MTTDIGMWRPDDPETRAFAASELETAPSLRGARRACPLERAAPGALDLRPFYRDEGLLGAGGSAVVRQALDLRLGRRVALKILRHESADVPELVRRFEQEACISARLDHPGVVTVLATGVLPRLHNLPFQALRIVRGRTLAEEFFSPVRTMRERMITFRARVEMVLRVAETIAHMHSHDVIHRDLKPANCMVGAHREVVVLDLGMSAGAGSRAHVGAVPGDALHSLDGRLSGTPAFMAPEQALGHRTGPFTDVHALGALLYCAWAGMPPRREAAEAIAAAAAGTLFDLTKVADTPDELRALITSALATEPRRRPPTAQAFVDRLQGWLDGSMRMARAGTRVQAAQTAQSELKALEAQERRCLHTAAQLRTRLGARPSVDELAEVWDIEAVAQRLKRQQALVRTRRDALLIEALTHCPDHPIARQQLADHALADHRDALRRSDDDAAAVALWHLDRHDLEHRHAHYRSGRGWWSLKTSAPVRVEVAPLHDHQRRMVAGDVRFETHGPVTDWQVPLAVGGWLATLHTEDHRTFRLPFTVQRSQHAGPPADAPVTHIPSAQEVPVGFVYVPAGPYRSGGDARAYGEVQEDAVEQHLDGFAIARFPVTVAEWIAFLDDTLRTHGVAAAMQWTPGSQSVETRGQHPHLLRLSGDHTHFECIEDHAGPDTPVVLIDHAASLAYIAWRSARDGQPYRLPWELEVEKAARGADHRRFPFGNTYHPSFAATSVSFEANRYYPPSTRAFPLDVSPYGVRGLGGGVSCRCQDAFAPHGPQRRGATWSPAVGEPGTGVARGGTYVSGVGKSHIGSRVRVTHGLRAYSLGLRLCLSVGPQQHRTDAEGLSGKD